ncbi:MAG: carboxymuconolactone decarboxylase family protein [Bacteroidales bacterium]|nr:carboxymuconolactone decarboxylase family protein [Bacteroidales bacterium]MBN2699072.1 carboxymuconolactone decarboxylase family protein [Bacteroidales bacterium]
MSKYSVQAKSVFDFIGTLSKENSKIAEGFVTMHKATASDSALTAKTKELIALGIAITIRCEGCIACHVQGALQAGATKEEIVETIGVAVVMGGGPSIVYGDKAYEAMKEMASVAEFSKN